MKRVLLWLSGLFALGMSILLELAFHDPSHTELPWHGYPAFDFLFGVLGCALIVIVSKWLGHQFLQRDESYYDSNPETDA